MIEVQALRQGGLAGPDRANPPSPMKVAQMRATDDLRGSGLSARRPRRSSACSDCRQAYDRRQRRTSSLLMVAMKGPWRASPLRPWLAPRARAGLALAPVAAAPQRRRPRPLALRRSVQL